MRVRERARESEREGGIARERPGDKERYGLDVGTYVKRDLLQCQKRPTGMGAMSMRERRDKERYGLGVGTYGACLCVCVCVCVRARACACAYVCGV